MAMRRAPVVSTEQRSWTEGSTPSETDFRTVKRAAATTVRRALSRSRRRSGQARSAVPGSA